MTSYSRAAFFISTLKSALPHLSKARIVALILTIRVGAGGHS